MYEHIHKDYKIVKREADAYCCIQILTPPFEGLIYRYIRYHLINLGTPQEGIEFDYEVQKMPEGLVIDPPMYAELEALLGKILLGVLEEQLRINAEREEEDTIEFDGEHE